METNLQNIPNTVKLYKKIAKSGGGSRKIESITMNDEIIILKYHKTREKYEKEKRIYIRLKNEDFLPSLKYFDDKNKILGMTDVGDSVLIYKNNNRSFFENYNKQLKDIVGILLKKYNIYHNDLFAKNICIGQDNKVRLVDFEEASRIQKRNRNNYCNLMCLAKIEPPYPTPKSSLV